MAKASDNVFPYVHVAPAAAPSSPSAGSERLYLDSADGNKLKRKDSSGTVTTIEGGSSTGGIIARTSYDPASLASYTTSSTTDADVDATNLAVTFTVPASGAVLIRLEAHAGFTGTYNDAVNWGLRNGSTTVKSVPVIGGVLSSSSQGPNSSWTKTFYVSGLTPGASLTYKWSWKVNSGAVTGRLYASTAAGAAAQPMDRSPRWTFRPGRLGRAARRHRRRAQ